LNKAERIILTSTPVKWVSGKAKHIYLPGFQGATLYDVWKFFMRQVRTVGLNERAAAISFNFLMALPAAMIFLFTIIPYLPIAKQINSELLLLTKDLSPNQNTYRMITGIISDFMNKQGGGVSLIGILLVVFYASNAMMGIMNSFNRSLTVTKKTNFLQKRWTAIKLTTLLVVLVIGFLTLLFTQDALLKLILKWIGVKSISVKWLIKSLRWFVIIALFFYSIAFIYKYAPANQKRWRLGSPGAILATFLTIATTILFSWWVNYFANYNKVYGSIGTLLVLMALTFFNALVLLIGFELNVSINALRAKAEAREKTESTNGAVKS
jgi:membrane protein